MPERRHVVVARLIETQMLSATMIKGTMTTVPRVLTPLNPEERTSFNPTTKSVAHSPRSEGFQLESPVQNVKDIFKINLDQQSVSMPLF